MARIATSLATVLAAVRDKLVSDRLFNKSLSFVSLDPDVLAEKAPPGDVFAGVTFDFFAQPPDSVGTDAPTDDVQAVEGIVTVALYFQISVDSIGREDQVVTDSAQGAIAKIEAVAAALHNRELTNAAGANLLMCSLTFLNVKAKGKVGKTANYRRFDLSFQAAFEWNLIGFVPA